MALRYLAWATNKAQTKTLSQTMLLGSRHSPFITLGRPIVFSSVSRFPLRAPLSRSASVTNTAKKQANNAVRTSTPAPGASSRVTSEKDRRLLAVGESSSEAPSGRAILNFLSRYLWPQDKQLRDRVKISLALLLGAKLASISVPFYFKYIVDSLSIPMDGQLTAALPLAALCGYGIARLLNSLFHEARGHVFTRVSEFSIRDISQRTFRHLHDLDLAFHQHRNTGALNTSINRGTRTLNFMFNSLIFNVVPTVAEMAVVCGILGYNFGPAFAGVAFLTLSTYIAFTVAVTMWRTKFRKQMNTFESKASAISYDSLTNYETVKYFNNEAHEVRRFESKLKEYADAAEKSASSLSLLNFGQNAIFSVGLSAIMFMAARGIVSGGMSVGDLVLVNSLLFQLSMPLNFVGTMYREIKQSFADLATIMGLQGIKTNICDAPNAQPLDLRGGRVEFRNVSYSYSDRVILKRLSFTVPAGKTVAVVGASGSGKSTLLRLLYRFDDPQEGSVIIDGQDLRSLSLDSLRRAIGVVPQDTSLFNETIYYNISYGNPEASREAVIEAAKLARIHDAIMNMPLQYESEVGERGIKLSGGEKQRIAIARMILKAPAIVLCDEATSALDSTVERELLQNLRDVCSGRTTVMIAHRLSTIVDADWIVVIGEGGVAEEGTHKSLIENENSLYSKMWAMQLHEKAKIELNK